MKNVISISAAAVLVALAGIAQADEYFDATGDLFDNGFTHLDISSVVMTNDASNLFVTVNNVGDISSGSGTDWGKYLVFFDTQAGGRADPSNPWGRNIITNVETDFFIGSWVDSGGGAQFWGADVGANPWDLINDTFDGSGLISMDLSNAASGSVTYTISLSILGVGIGDVILFDVATTGGGDGDPGVDHLSRADMATPGWGDPSEAGQYSAYTLIPAPGAAGLLALGGLLATRRRRA